MDNLVFYHHPCVDGIHGALPPYLALPAGTVTFIPYDVNKKDEENEKLLEAVHSHHTVYLVDTVGYRGFAKAVSERAKKLVILDHHKTAVDEIDGWKATSSSGSLPANVEAVIDMKRSGATISLDYFRHLIPDHVNLDNLEGKFRLVEDHDLWTYKLPDTKAFHYGFCALQLNYNHQENPGIFDLLMAVDVQKLIEHGRSLLAEREATIEGELVKRFELTVTDGTNEYTFYAVENADHTIRSDLGHKLACLSEEAGLPPLGAVCGENEGRTKISLRSNRGFDSTKISVHYGGGGHAGASSFSVDHAAYLLMKQRVFVLAHDTELSWIK